MVVDAVRAYFDAVNGLTELTRRRAVAAAKVILKSEERRASASAPSADSDGAPRPGSPIQTLAGELIETGEANREALNSLVSAEVERALERLDVVSRADYDRLARRVAELERRLAAQPLLPRPAHHTLPDATDPHGAAVVNGNGSAEAVSGGQVGEQAPTGPGRAPEAAAKPEPEPQLAATETAREPDAAGGVFESVGDDTPDDPESEKPDSARTPTGAAGGQTTTKKKSSTTAANRQQRSTKAKSGSGRTQTSAKSGAAKRPNSRGKNGTKDDQ